MPSALKEESTYRREHWFKWKIKGQYLIEPGGMKFTPRMLAAAWRVKLKNEADEPNPSPCI